MNNKTNENKMKWIREENKALNILMKMEGIECHGWDMKSNKVVILDSRIGLNEYKYYDSWTDAYKAITKQSDSIHWAKVLLEEIKCKLDNGIDKIYITSEDYEMLDDLVLELEAYRKGVIK